MKPELLKDYLLFEKNHSEKQLGYALDRLQSLLNDAKAPRGQTSSLVMNASNPLSEIAHHAARLDLLHAILDEDE